MNFCDFICEWCSEIEHVVSGVVKLNLFLVELNLFMFMLELGVGVEVGAGRAGASSIDATFCWFFP
jgi:hypothetical protein